MLLTLGCARENVRGRENYRLYYTGRGGGTRVAEHEVEDGRDDVEEIVS